KAGITVVEIPDAQNLQDSLERIHIIGQQVDRVEQANQIVNDMKSRIESMRKRASDNSVKKAYVELDAGQWTVGGNSYLNDILQIIGLSNIFAERNEPYLMVTMESIVSRDPDIVISLNRTREDYASSPAWQVLRAVKEGRMIGKNDMDWNV